MNETVIDTAIVVTYILLGIAALTAVIFPIFQLITNFKRAKGALLGVVVLAVVLLIGYGLSTDEVYAGFNVTSTQSQWIGGAIKATMILVGMAVVAAVYTEISKLVR
jgi:hypothetical protein